MRIPYYINKNTAEEYYPSSESKHLVGEKIRQLVSEDLEWDKEHILPLDLLCVIVISKNFEKFPILEELPCHDKEYLIEILPTDLDLQLVVPLIDYEHYWQRRYADKFGLVLRKKPEGWTWKSLFIERYVEDLVEQAEPQYNDEDEMDDTLKLCTPYIRRLIITQLQAWKPPLTWEKEDIPDIYPIDHISFIPILSKLGNIEELEIIYGMNNVGDKFNWNMFTVSVPDCQRLGKGLLSLKSLQIFRLHRSKLCDEHVQTLVQFLVKNQTLVELDLSNCQFGDHGALNIAKFLMVHPRLQYLNIANNKIGTDGAKGIGYALQESADSLRVLNIKLNSLGYDGTVSIITGVLHGKKLNNLILAGCDMDEETCIRVCNFIHVDTTLKKLDISNNYFSDDIGEQLVESVKHNKTLEWLDVRETDITDEQMQKINCLLYRNRSGEELPSEEEVQEEEVAEVPNEEEGPVVKEEASEMNE